MALTSARRYPVTKSAELHAQAIIEAAPSGPWLDNLPDTLARDIPEMAQIAFGNRAFTLAYAVRRLWHPLLCWQLYAQHIPDAIRAIYTDVLIDHGEPFAKTPEEAAIAIAEALRRSGYSVRITETGVVFRPPTQWNACRAAH